MNLYIKVGSITNAQRAKSVLNKNSVKAVIQRLENPVPGDGCGYVIRTEDNEHHIKAHLERNGIRILGTERS